MVWAYFVVEPPSEIRPGDTLYPTPVVKISGGSGHLWAYATLLNDDGQIVHDLLSGTTIDTAQSLPDFDDVPNYPRPDRGDLYVAFPDLEIQSEGDFRIRVTIMSNSTVGTASLEEAESRSITVKEGASSTVYLGYEEEGYLEALRADGRNF